MDISFSLVIAHNDTVRHHPLTRPATRIGRDPSSDILIADPTISRHQLTIERRDETVYVEMNPKSPNVMVRNGCLEMTGELHPGEIFYVGPYRFEIHASTALPEARSRGLHEDPAGPIDLKQLEEGERMAPRWRSASVEVGKGAAAGKDGKEASESPGIQATTDEAPGLSPSARIALMAVLCLLGGYLAYDFMKPPADEEKLPTVSFSGTDLLAAVKPIACQSPSECLERARDADRIATDLVHSSARDLVTLYKIAKLLHRAQLALGKDADQLPDLKARYTRARAQLQIAFADQAFFYQRALAENQTKEQKQLLQNILPICREDRQPFCQSLELAFQRFPDNQ